MSLSKETVCRGMIVTQGLTDGFLGGPYQATFSLNENISVSVDQCGIRTVELTSSKAILCGDLFDTFQSVEKLLMLCDGRFYPITKLEFEDEQNNDLERFLDVSKEILDKRLGYFASKDFCQYSFLNLLSFQDALSKELYSRWESLLEQMDIAYQVFLYSLSDNKNPIDMNFAFLVELAEPFVELVKESTYLCQTLSPGERGTTLKMCVDALITHFGTDVFEKELNGGNYPTFLDAVIGSRVRIMHIKKKQGKYFDGQDCVRYSMKFSLLYRRIIFELLKIPYGSYEQKLKVAVRNIDEWQP